jgi:hypothetical protein
MPWRKTTLWLGPADSETGSTGSYDVHREDDMVSIGYAGTDEDGEDLEVFILPGLFPAIRAAMKAAEATRPGKKGKTA